MLVTKQVRDLSGIVYRQVVPATASVDLIDEFVYQEFFLPKDYKRGSKDVIIPELTGLQVFCGVTDRDSVTVDWTLDYYFVGEGWRNLGTGTSASTPHDGEEVWMDIYFDESIQITDDLLDLKFRFGIQGREEAEPVVNEEATYDGKTRVTFKNGTYVDVPVLQVNVPVLFTHTNGPGVLMLKNDGNVYWSSQLGPTHVWFSSPNPLSKYGLRALEDDETTPITHDGSDVALIFRLLGTSPDHGEDFLGNNYRSVLYTHDAANVSTLSGSLADKYWQSRANPSKFAIENLYFDLRDGTKPQVIDKILIDPETPGVYFSVYYSDEGQPGTTEEEWDSKLWKRVPQNFKLDKRRNYALEEPISAKYVCIEFTHLQPRSYTPGEFQQAVTYKKHPKWVLDYFLLRTEARNKETEDLWVAREVGVRFDAMDLAYNYYMDDVREAPADPADQARRYELKQFLDTRDDTSDQIDQVTAAFIATEMKPWTNSPALRGKSDYMPSNFLSSFSNNPDYPIEVPPIVPLPDTELVSTYDRDAVVFELSTPVMFFYVPCRHIYRRVTAELDKNVAYFVGIREISFGREQYIKAHDHNLYIESTNDLLNVERSDFALLNQEWYVYSRFGD